MVREANDGFIGSSLSHEQNNKEINIVKVNKNRVMNFIFDNFMQKYKKNRNPQSYVFSKSGVKIEILCQNSILNANFALN